MSAPKSIRLLTRKGTRKADKVQLKWLGGGSGPQIMVRPRRQKYVTLTVVLVRLAILAMRFEFYELVVGEQSKER